METIHFQTEVGEGNLIRVPEGVTLPPGPAEITVAPMTIGDSNSATGDVPFPKREDFATTWEWLYAVGKQAEKWDTDRPLDLAKNHDFYAHEKRTE